MVIKTMPLYVQIQVECGTKKISQSLCSKICKDTFLIIKWRGMQMALYDVEDVTTWWSSSIFKHMVQQASSM